MAKARGVLPSMTSLSQGEGSLAGYVLSVMTPPGDVPAWSSVVGGHAGVCGGMPKAASVTSQEDLDEEAITRATGGPHGHECQTVVSGWRSPARGTRTERERPFRSLPEGRGPLAEERWRDAIAR